MISAAVGVVQFFVRRTKDASIPEVRSVADTLAVLTAAATFLGTSSLIVEVIVSPIYLKSALLAIASILALIAMIASFVYIGIKRAKAGSRT